MNQRCSSDPINRSRTLAATIATLSLVTLSALTVLAVDVGHVCALTVETQDNADAAALAGTGTLRRGNPHLVFERALGILTRHKVPQGRISPNNQVVELGRWDAEAKTFRPLPLTAAEQANSVRVVNRHNSGKLLLSVLGGVRPATVSREAVATLKPTRTAAGHVTRLNARGQAALVR